MLTEPKWNSEKLLTGNLLKIRQLYEISNIYSMFVYSSAMMRQGRLENSCCFSLHAGHLLWSAGRQCNMLCAADNSIEEFSL